MKAQLLSSSDIITTLPQAIIETILCLLRIEEAARTSILSREWRYKWTTIPKLMFSESTVSETANVSDLDDMARARKKMDLRCKRFYAIHQVLLLRQAPIHEFTLSMSAADDTCFEIDQIILHLSRNHPVKKLTLEIEEFSLPLSLFSLHQLTDLSLEDCKINHKPMFNGFGSLTSLTMSDVRISGETLLHLLSNCQSLKTLYLLASYASGRDEQIPTIMELFNCLPVIEHLTTTYYYVKRGVRRSDPQELPVSLLHLKYFCFKEMRFADSNVCTFLFALIKCSPNLEKIKIKTVIGWDNGMSSGVLEQYSIKLEEYSDFRLEHLNELKINDFFHFKPIMEFVKFILVKSPNLKKVILRTWMQDKNEELKMLKILLRAPRASSVEIIVDNEFKG